MNWEAIGAIGEILGAMAVVFSVLYLALQIRENTKQTKFQFDAVQQEQIGTAFEAFSRFNTILLSDPSYVSIWHKAQDSYDTLEDSERQIAGKLFQEYMACFNLMYMINTDEVSQLLNIEDLTDWMEELLSDLLVKQGFRSWWDENRFRYNTAGFGEKMGIVIDKYRDT